MLGLGRRAEKQASLHAPFSLLVELITVIIVSPASSTALNQHKHTLHRKVCRLARPSQRHHIVTSLHSV